MIRTQTEQYTDLTSSLQTDAQHGVQTEWIKHSCTRGHTWVRSHIAVSDG